MNYLRNILIVAVASALGLMFADPGFARGKSNGKNVARAEVLKLHHQFVATKKKYRLGELDDRSMWLELDRFHKLGHKLTRADRVSLLQMQAHMLLSDNFPILASIYASQAIKIAKDPSGRELQRSWSILKTVSQKRPIQNLLAILAGSTKVKNGEAPQFSSDWHYFVANALVKKKQIKEAMSEYGKLKVTDRYFFPAKYQQAMIFIDNNQFDEAMSALKSILLPTSHQLSSLPEQERRDMVDYAYMAMGRIYYEQREFINAVKMYRQVSRNGINFYDSLFEQSWAFFLGGYPAHALGALHAVESPFYAKVFNPEAPIMRSLVNYWLCRYGDSRNALADFLEKHSPAVEALEGFLDRKRLDPETAYQLFENLITGVSSESLGIPREVLLTASESDSMLLVRDQYAAIVEENYMLESRGVYGSKKGLKKSADYLKRWGGALRRDIGSKFTHELQGLKDDYDRLYSQAQFLYVELLMSEKDQLLGKELHASSKITKVSSKQDVSGWGSLTQAWKGSDKEEFWWDELGFFLQPIESHCQLSPGQK